MLAAAGAVMVTVSSAVLSFVMVSCRRSSLLSTPEVCASSMAPNVGSSMAVREPAQVYWSSPIDVPA